MPITLKIHYTKGGKTEIRRTVLDPADDISTARISECMQRLWPESTDADLKIVWKDNEGDDVTISTDDELNECLKNSPDGIIRLYISEKKSAGRSLARGRMDGEGSRRDEMRRWRRMAGSGRGGWSRGFMGGRPWSGRPPWLVMSDEDDSGTEKRKEKVQKTKSHTETSAQEDRGDESQEKDQEGENEPQPGTSGEEGAQDKGEKESAPKSSEDNDRHVNWADTFLWWMPGWSSTDDDEEEDSDDQETGEKSCEEGPWSSGPRHRPGFYEKMAFKTMMGMFPGFGMGGRGRGMRGHGPCGRRGFGPFGPSGRRGGCGFSDGHPRGPPGMMPGHHGHHGPHGMMGHHGHHGPHGMMGHHGPHGHHGHHEMMRCGPFGGRGGHGRSWMGRHHGPHGPFGNKAHGPHGRMACGPFAGKGGCGPRGRMGHCPFGNMGRGSFGRRCGFGGPGRRGPGGACGEGRPWSDESDSDHCPEKVQRRRRMMRCAMRHAMSDGTWNSSKRPRFCAKKGSIRGCPAMSKSTGMPWDSPHKRRFFRRMMARKMMGCRMRKRHAGMVSEDSEEETLCGHSDNDQCRGEWGHSRYPGRRFRDMRSDGDTSASESDTNDVMSGRRGMPPRFLWKMMRHHNRRGRGSRRERGELSEDDCEI